MTVPVKYKEKGWVRAEELLPGDFFKQRNGEYAEITYIRQEKEEKEQWVYNLEVEGLHSYYVAGEELLVHNGKGVCPGGRMEIKSGSSSIYREVNIHGKINTEIDEVDLANRIIYEDKTAGKLYMENADFPQTEQQ